MKNIVIKENLDIPGTDITLERGDVIRVLERERPEYSKTFENAIGKYIDSCVADADGGVPSDSHTLGYRLGMSLVDMVSFRFGADPQKEIYEGIVEAAQEGLEGYRDADDGW